MKIECNLKNEEFEELAKRNSLINIDTYSSVLKTDFYDIDLRFAGEIRYGPAYYHLKIYSREYEIWDGGRNIYSSESFKYNAVGDKYDKLILLKWFSTNNPYEQTVVEINLNTGMETALDMRQRYWASGHFYSFDGAFYKKNDIEDFLCKDFEYNIDFLLFERIRARIKSAFQWSISPVDDCIVVYSKEKQDNVVLFNIRKKEIIDYQTYDFELSERGCINSSLDKNSNVLIINTHDYELSEDNHIRNSRNKYYRIIF